MPAEVSVSLLAEVERELLRLRAELSVGEWRSFCGEFPKRRVFEVLRLGSHSMDLMLAETFQARPYASPSPAHVVNAWEYSLPVSRSLRTRRRFFRGEIEEVLGTLVKPRILVLGGGRLREAEHAIGSGRHLHHAEFVALEQDSKDVEFLYATYARNQQLHIVQGSWPELGSLQSGLGRFDLIYCPGWLDWCDDSEAAAWLSVAVDMLRAGGRLLAANFAPGSRDAGWVEACWNWQPQYRGEEDLAYLTTRLKASMLRGHAIFRDESGASAFLEIHSL